VFFFFTVLAGRRGSCFFLRFRVFAAEGDLREIDLRSNSLKTKESSLEDTQDFQVVVDWADVVLCDDNVINSKVMMRMLAELGVQVKAFLDGASCLQYLIGARKLHPNRKMLVLLDNSMPGISGVDLCKVWREYETLAGLDSALLRICMISAAPIRPTKYFDETVVKPITRKMLSKILTQS
jgi:CheY-like chemotaxis protein